MTFRMFYTSDTERSQLTEHKMRPGVPFWSHKKSALRRGSRLRIIILLSRCFFSGVFQPERSNKGMGREWANVSHPNLPLVDRYISHPLTLSCSSCLLIGTPAKDSKGVARTYYHSSFAFPATFFSQDKKKQYSAIYYWCHWIKLRATWLRHVTPNKNATRSMMARFQLPWPLLNALTANPQCFVWNACFESFKNRKSRFCSKYKAVKYHANEKLNQWNSRAWERFYFPFEKKMANTLRTVITLNRSKTITSCQTELYNLKNLSWLLFGRPN